MAKRTAKKSAATSVRAAARLTKLELAVTRARSVEEKRRRQLERASSDVGAAELLLWAAREAATDKLGKSGKKRSRAAAVTEGPAASTTAPASSPAAAPPAPPPAKTAAPRPATKKAPTSATADGRRVGAPKRAPAAAQPAPSAPPKPATTRRAAPKPRSTGQGA